MHSETYITEETLHTGTLLELQQIREDLYREREKRRKKFQIYKDWVYEEFTHTFSWYKQRYVSADNINLVEQQLRTDINAASDAYAVAQVVCNSMSNLARSPELLKMLESKYIHMCLRGYLPRNFTIQVRPQIILLAQEYYLKYIDKNDGMFFKTNEEQINVFENLIKELLQVQDENATKKVVQTAIEFAEKLVKQRKNHVLWFLEDAWEHLLTSLKHFKQQLNLEGYTRENKMFTSDTNFLQEAIDNLDAQIALRQLDISEQIKRLKYYHEKAFASLKDSKPSSLAVKKYVEQQEVRLTSISNLSSQASDAILPKLQKAYVEFWNKTAEESIKFTTTASLQERSSWRALLGNLFKARQYLQQQPTSPSIAPSVTGLQEPPVSSVPEQAYLTKNYFYDKQFLILEKLEQHISRLYRNSINSIGNLRKQQLDELRQRIKSAMHEQEVAQITHSVLMQIEADHSERSLSFNIAVLRKSSRAAEAIKSFLYECENEKLLPIFTKSKPNHVEFVFAQAIEEYFSSDLWISSRTRRRISRKLLDTIHHINEQVESNKIMLIEGKQKIATIIDCAIAEAEKIHKEGTGITRVLRMVGYQGHSRFVNCLQKTKENLLARKQLETSYQLVTWPIVKARLEKLIYEYRALKTSASPEADGVKEAMELLIQIQDATNAEHACYMLHLGISSLDTGFPELASKLSACYQELRKEGVLPAISHTEFAKHLREKIKQQAKEVTELKHRLIKLN